MNGRQPLNLRVFGPMAVIGFGVMTFGAYGLIDNSDRTHPSQWIRWFFGAALAHDFVVAPLVVVVGLLLASRVSPRYRAILQGVLIVSGTVAVTALPFVLGYGRRPDNRTVLPNNYALGLLAVAAVIWLFAGYLTWRAHRNAASTSQPDRK